MSRENVHTLNTNTLIGHTATRGTAWHYRAEYQGSEPNHYPGAIPIADVRRRLFTWRAEAQPLAFERPADPTTMTHLGPDGQPMRWVRIPDRLAIVRSDRSDGSVLALLSTDYSIHQYDEWLLTAVGNVLDDSLSISSAGLLRDGAVAWVEVSVPASITTPDGVQFRPNLLATTTLDGTEATTYKRTVTNVVCDNTRAAALRERGQEVKIRHVRGARLAPLDARDALQMIHTTAEDFTKQVAKLCSTAVDDAAWGRFLDAWVPRNVPAGRRLSVQGMLAAEQRRDSLDELYRRDHRVAPWTGTAYGVLQAVNTYEHHIRGVRGRTRAERNMQRAVDGDFTAVDRKTWATLEKALAQA